MRIEKTDTGFALYKENERIGGCEVRSGACVEIVAFWIAPAWRRRGYGSYLLRQLLHRYGGYDTQAASCFTAPLPENGQELCFWEKFGFVREGALLVRRRQPDLSAVRFAQDFLAARLRAPRMLVDATCGNGGDTAFLYRLAGADGHVTAFDIQPAAIEATRARLAREGADPARCTLILDSHAHLLQYIQPGSADAVMFNFGWLPGADHALHSQAASSIPALGAALDALRPGGILSAVLYSGAVIGDSEKRAALAWLEALPLAKYTVLVCRFANWADTAPLPCFVIKNSRIFLSAAR